MLYVISFQRVPKLQAEDQAIWWDTLGKMQKLFRKASSQLYVSGKIDKDTMHNYFMSGKLPKFAYLSWHRIFALKMSNGSSDVD